MEEKKTNNKKGVYSSNKTIFSFLIFVIIFVFLTSGDLYIRTSHIKNHYIRSILTSTLKPIDNFATQIGISVFFSDMRKTTLELAQLSKEVDWEEFYYIAEEETEAGIQDQSIVKTDDLNKKLKKKNQDKKNNVKDTAIVANEDSSIPNKNIQEKKETTEKEKKEHNMKEGLESSYNEEEALGDAGFNLSPYIYDERNPFHLLMVGDSQMYSIANGLKKLTAGQDSIEITDISIHSSGFIRGDYYNWEKKLENIFKEKPNYYHAVVILLGMNDYQDIYNNNNTVLVRETPQWEEKYRDKIVRVMNLLLLNSKKVYWLGMPIVRRASYNDDLRYIDKLQDDIAREYNHIGLKRIPLSGIAPGEGVPYTDTVQKKDGTIIRLMKTDGVHYTIAGGQYVMEEFLKELYSEWYIKP